MKVSMVLQFELLLGGHEKVVDILLEHGADVNLHSSNGYEPILFLGLTLPDLAILRALIVAGAELDSDTVHNALLLGAACSLSDLSIVTLFPDNTADVNLN